METRRWNDVAELATIFAVFGCAMGKGPEGTKAGRLGRGARHDNLEHLSTEMRSLKHSMQQPNISAMSVSVTPHLDGFIVSGCPQPEPSMKQCRWALIFCVDIGMLLIVEVATKF